VISTIILLPVQQSKKLSKRFFLFSVVLLITSCASLPDNSQRQASYALNPEATAVSVLGKGVSRQREQSEVDDAEQSGMLLLGDGQEALIARAALARQAERTLDVQYYLFHEDLSGGVLSYELWQAAERGVRVRVLLDDLSLGGRDDALATLNAHPNVNVRLFNPFIRGKSRTGQLLSRFGSVTRRMHNKAFIADNQLAIIGGRNIGDEYFGANPNMAFGDLDVMLTNPAAQSVSEEFDLFWNSDLSYPVETLAAHQPSAEELKSVADKLKDFVYQQENADYLQALKNNNAVDQVRKGSRELFWGKATILSDDPEKISADRDSNEFHLTTKLSPYITGVQKELIVISPYFVPGKEGMELFRALRDKGIEVKILTNSLASNDVPIVHSGYVTYRKRLLKMGVELYEVDKTALGSGFKRHKSGKTREGVKGSKASLHAKYFVMDRQRAFIGSLNMDPRSVVENTEIGAVIESEKMALALAEDFDKNILNIAFELHLEDGNVVWQRHGNTSGNKDDDNKGDENGDEILYKEPHTTWWDRFSVTMMRLLPAESQL